jgi:TonB family protein
MGDIRHCKWCGRSYDTDKSTSHYPYAYCSLRCEIQGEKATNNSEARSDRRFMNYFVIPLIIFGVIISIFGDHDEKSDNKKKSAKTERTKNAATTNNESDATYNSAAESDIEKINESLLDKTNEEAKLSATEEEQLELQEPVNTTDATEAALNESSQSGNDAKTESSVTDENENTSESSVVDNKVYSVVEQMPNFPGGEAALLEYISANLKYPQSALEQGTQGTVMLRFVVTGTGDIGEVQILKGLDPDCNNEAIRVVKSLPKFNPGMQQGRPVSVWYTIPVRFVIE